MNLNDYQTLAGSFAQYQHELYPPLGLSEEVGEYCGVLAKSLRKEGHVSVDAVEKAKKELGDVLWQVQENASFLGFTLEEIAQANLDKLTDRRKRGVIVGEGDNR